VVVGQEGFGKESAESGKSGQLWLLLLMAPCDLLSALVKAAREGESSSPPL